MKTRTLIVRLGIGVATCLFASSAQAVSEEGAHLIFNLILIGIIGIIINFIPSFVAFQRHHPNRWLILLLNAVFGATVLGWFGCLIWAMQAIHISEDPRGSHGGESGLNIFANDVKRVRVEPSFGLSAPVLPAAPPATGPAPDAIKRLERLKKLLDDGVIDADQFHRMRAAIIPTSIEDDIRPFASERWP